MRLAVGQVLEEQCVISTSLNDQEHSTSRDFVYLPLNRPRGQTKTPAVLTQRSYLIWYFPVRHMFESAFCISWFDTISTRIRKCTPFPTGRALGV